MNSSYFPVVKILIPYIFGIFIAYFSLFGSYSVIIAAALAFGFFLFSIVISRKRTYFCQYITTLSLQTAFIFAGYFTTFLPFHRQINKKTATILEQSHYFKAEVLAPFTETEKSYKGFLLVESCLNGDTLIPINEEVLCYFQQDSALLKLNAGNIIYIYTRLQKIKPAQNPEQFNYQRHLQKKGILLQCYISKRDVCKSEESGLFSVRQKAMLVQQFLAQKLINAGLNGAEFEIMAAILLGYSKSLDPELKASYASAGVSHILCVSGMHVGIIFMILNTLLHPLSLSKRGRPLQILLLFLALWSYALITGLSPSVTRAATMFSFVLVGKCLHRRASTFQSLFASLFILLVINPLYLFEVGFQLSYLAVFGIVIFQKIFNEWYQPKHRLGKYVYGLLTVSISAQLATFPLTIFYFGQFPNYFILANLSVITLSFTIIVSGISVLFTSFSSVISEFLGNILHYQIKLMNGIITRIEHIPNAVTENISINFIQVIILYIFIWFLVLYQKERKKLIIYIIPICVASFVLDKTITLYQKNHNTEWCIFSINKELAISFSQNGTTTLFSDSIRSKEDRNYQYNIKDYIEKKGKIVGLRHWEKERYFKFNGETFFILKNREEYNAYSSPFEVDYLIINQYFPKNPEIIMETFKCNKVILCGNIHQEQEEAWEQYLVAEKINYFNIKKEGAYISKK